MWLREFTLIKRVTFWFALTGYFLTFLYYYGPWGIANNEFLYHVLPYWMCLLAIGGMPVPAVALWIAPINALIYGIVGAFVAWLVATMRQRSIKPIT
jgi:hypothetical protein